MMGESCLVMGHYVGKLTEMLEESEVEAEAVEVTTTHNNFLTTWLKAKSALNLLT